MCTVSAVWIRRSAAESLPGSPRPFTFFTIQTTPTQLKKCKFSRKPFVGSILTNRPEHHVGFHLARSDPATSGGQAEV